MDGYWYYVFFYARRLRVYENNQKELMWYEIMNSNFMSGWYDDGCLKIPWWKIIYPLILRL